MRIFKMAVLAALFLGCSMDPNLEPGKLAERLREIDSSSKDYDDDTSAYDELSCTDEEEVFRFRVRLEPGKIHTNFRIIPGDVERAKEEDGITHVFSTNDYSLSYEAGALFQPRSVGVAVARALLLTKCPFLLTADRVFTRTAWDRWMSRQGKVLEEADEWIGNEGTKKPL